MKKTLFFLGAMAVLIACNPNGAEQKLVDTTPIVCHSTDTTMLTPKVEGSYTIATADSCIVQPLQNGLGVRAVLVGKTNIYVNDDKGHTDTIAVTVKPRITMFTDILPLLGASKTELKSKMGEPLKETTDNIYYKLSEDSIAYAAYRFDNGKVSRIYAYPETYYAEFYDYLNERYFIEVVDESTANYYNHFDLNRATLKIHFALNASWGDPFWFAEYSAFDPANPYGVDSREVQAARRK